MYRLCRAPWMDPALLLCSSCPRLQPGKPSGHRASWNWIQSWLGYLPCSSIHMDWENLNGCDRWDNLHWFFWSQGLSSHIQSWLMEQRYFGAFFRLLKTQRCSLGFSEMINLFYYYYYLRPIFLLLMFNSVMRMENPLMEKWEKFFILHFCSLLRNGWGVHAPLCCQLLFCCMCYFTVSSLWWLTETCQLFLISLQAWKSSLEGCV